MSLRPDIETEVQQLLVNGQAYRLKKALGSGNSGQVWLGTSPTGEEVVIKDHYENGVARQEAQTLQLLYPQLFIDADHKLVVSKFTPGRTAGTRSTTSVAPVVTDVLKDLTKLHARGLLHNDVKPDNIYVDNEGESRLLDFELVSGALTKAERQELARLKSELRALNENEPENGFTEAQSDQYDSLLDAISVLKGKGGNKGDALYAPPEYTPPDYPSDVYSTGATAYDLLMGKRAIYCGPQEYATHVPPQVAEVLDKALACEPSDRFQNAQEFLAAWTKANS